MQLPMISLKTAAIGNSFLATAELARSFLELKTLQFKLKSMKTEVLRATPKTLGCFLGI